MEYRIKIKTGFFKTTIYLLSIRKGSIQLTPLNNPSNESIHIDEQDLIKIRLSQSKFSTLEIKTKDRTILGTFHEKQNLQNIHQELQKSIKSKIIYEEE